MRWDPAVRLPRSWTIDSRIDDISALSESEGKYGDCVGILDSSAVRPWLGDSTFGTRVTISDTLVSLSDLHARGLGFSATDFRVF